MAASDNVVRAGLTPKLKDVENLTKMLTYKYGSAESQILKGDATGRFSTLYDPPIEEFSVILTSLEAKQVESLASIDGPSILIATHGKGTFNGHKLAAGSVYFVPAGTNINLSADLDSGLTVYTAFCQL